MLYYFYCHSVVIELFKNLPGVWFKSCFVFLVFRLQANTTGQRLKDLNLKYTKLVCSNLIRAVETADIIASYLPDVPRETCCMLREGAPVKPDPSPPNWKPEKKVSVRNTGVDRGGSWGILSWKYFNLLIWSPWKWEFVHSEAKSACYDVLFCVI